MMGEVPHTEFASASKRAHFDASFKPRPTRLSFISCLFFLIFLSSYPQTNIAMFSPPSNFNFPSSSAPVDSPRRSSSPGNRPIVDPLAFENVHGLAGSLPGARNGNGGASEAEEEGAIQGGRGRRQGRRGVELDAIPRVKDTTGEKVMESFILFLEKLVMSLSIHERALTQVTQLVIQKPLLSQKLRGLSCLHLQGMSQNTMLSKFIS